MSALKLAVVRLDDARYGAGPATVLALVGTVEEYNALVTDRDGARDERARCWRAYDGAEPGDRVTMLQLGDNS